MESSALTFGILGLTFGLMAFLQVNVVKKELQQLREALQRQNLLPEGDS